MKENFQTGRLSRIKKMYLVKKTKTPAKKPNIKKLIDIYKNKIGMDIIGVKINKSKAKYFR